jgi:hypothetical protein
MGEEKRARGAGEEYSEIAGELGARDGTVSPSGSPYWRLAAL